MASITLLAAMLAASTHAIDITLLDAQTGQWRRGAIHLSSDAVERTETCAGRCSLRLSSGRHQITITARGYRSLSSEVAIAADTPRKLFFELTARGSEQPAKKATGQYLSGYLTRGEDGAALSGATISLLPDGEQTQSNASGYFQLPLADHGKHQPTTLSITSRHRSLTLNAADGFQPGERLRLSVPNGQSSQRRTLNRALQHAPDAREAPDLRRLPDPKAAIVRRGLLTLPPPDAIRVGDDCIGRVCNEVRVMALETYVAGGLAREWIASWPAASLHAGAIAYRSYAAWHVNNPINAAYDICNSTSCQVWQAGGHANTDQAVAATAGMLLNHPEETGPFRSEYSAENNNLLGSRSCSNVDLSCGDGAVGSPATGWPCLNDDPVATGQSCFGHGRGMSQWGTQGWASLGYSWNWITNHYYNANGFGSERRQAEITRPFADLGLEYARDSIGVGSQLTLHWSTDLPDTASTLPVWFGASLRCGGDVIDDPANDVLVTIRPGTQIIARRFRLSTLPAEGSCDVLVALYADGNLDGRLSAGDLVLVQRTEEDVLTLDRDQLFRDRFRR